MGKTKKNRSSIPEATAAKALFLSDRTCCVCKGKQKNIQIHHIDGIPSHHALENLAILCAYCHDLTQIHGGFYRRLNSELVILYRDDWLKSVAVSRAKNDIITDTNTNLAPVLLNLTVSRLEAYRSNKEYELIASEYHEIGNEELRDLYINEILKRKPSDYAIVYLRSLQGKLNLIPKGVPKRLIKQYTKAKDWTGLARLYNDLGDSMKAMEFYIKGMLAELRAGNYFSAAFYFKEIQKHNLVTSLFEYELNKAIREKDLWWQVRCLQELGWDSELKNFFMEHKKEIAESNDLVLKSTMAFKMGDFSEHVRLEKEIAKLSHATRDGNIITEYSDSVGNLKCR